MFRATPCSSSGELIASIQHLVYVTLGKWLSSMQVRQFLPDRQSPTQSDVRVYQMMYWYNWFSWWWARCCSKQVQNCNKHIRKKKCASSWLFTRIIRRCEVINHIIVVFRNFASAPKYRVVAICVTSKSRNKTENLPQQNHVSGRNLKF
jgi:hypothetical protein